MNNLCALLIKQSDFLYIAKENLTLKKVHELSPAQVKVFILTAMGSYFSFCFVYISLKLTSFIK